MSNSRDNYIEKIKSGEISISDVPIEFRTQTLCAEALKHNLAALEYFPESIIKIHINETIKTLRENPSYLDGTRFGIDTASDTASEAIFSQGTTYYEILLNHIAKKKSEQLKKYNLYEQIVKRAINKIDIRSSLEHFFHDYNKDNDLSDLLNYVKKYIEVNWSEISFLILNTAHVYFTSLTDTQSIYNNSTQETIYDWILIAVNNNQIYILKDIINKNKINFDELSQYALSNHPELIEKLNAKKYFIKNKGISISQGVIRDILFSFLKQQKHIDVQTLRNFEYSSDQNISSGHCSALTFLFLYGKYLETHPDEDVKKVRDDNEWFFTTLYQVASWDKTQTTLSADNVLAFERLISLMQAYQKRFYQLFGMAGGTSLQTVFSDTKNRQLNRETSLTGFFDKQALASVLPELIKKDSLVYIGSHINKYDNLTHATGIFHTENYYYFYNSSFDDGVRITADINELTEWLFESYKFDTNSIAQFSFFHYGFSPNHEPINHQAILDKSYISSDSHNIKSLYHAIEINCLDSVKYFLDKTDINIEYEYCTPLSFALSYSGPNSEPNEAIISHLISKGAISKATDELRAKYLADSAEQAYNPAYIKLILTELIKINALEATLNEKNHLYSGDTILHKVLDKNFPSEIIIMMLKGNDNLMAKNELGEIPLKYIVDKHKQYADVLAYCIKHKSNEIASVISQAINDNQVDEIRPIFNSLKLLTFDDVSFKEIYNKLSSESKYTVIRECNIPPPPAPTDKPSLKSRQKFFPSAAVANTDIDHRASQPPSDDQPK